MQRKQTDIDIPMLRCQFNRMLLEDKPNYFKEDMILAVARIKQSRVKKSSHFNCVVIGDYSGETEEFSEFLKELNNHRDDLKEGSRFAILFYYKDAHWVAIDCQYVNNQFQFLIIDAAIYSSALEETILAITQQISNANIIYLELNKQTKIQRCYKECGTFSLDMLARLSTISNLYELINPLSSLPTDNFSIIYQEQIQRNKLHKLTVYDLPVELGCIVRNMHSVSLLTQLTSEKEYMASSHKKLIDYFQACVKQGENTGVEKKRKNIKRKTMVYYQTLSTSDIEMLIVRNENFIDHLIGKMIEEDKPNQQESSTALSIQEDDDPYYEATLTVGYVGQAIMQFFKKTTINADSVAPSSALVRGNPNI